jgi:hypothetical protein
MQQASLTIKGSAIRVARLGTTLVRECPNKPRQNVRLFDGMAKTINLSKDWMPSSGTPVERQDACFDINKVERRLAERGKTMMSLESAHHKPSELYVGLDDEMSSLERSAREKPQDLFAIGRPPSLPKELGWRIHRGPIRNPEPEL